jgi:prolipoprotein diacylglyceryl transferase
MIDYIIWNGSPSLFSIGSFALRWYGVLIVIGFLFSRQILFYIFKKEGHPVKDVETLTLFIVISSLLGARLGHVIFFQPELFGSKPLEVLLPFTFQPSFHFVGFQGLSIHGALLGMLLAIWLYCRKRNREQRYLRLLDRIVIIVPVITTFLLAGNFFNSEPIGKPTASAMGTVLTRPVVDGLLKVPCCIMRNPGGKNPLDFISVKKDKGPKVDSTGRSPILMYLFFKPGATEQIVNEFLLGDVKTYLFDRSEYVYESGTEPIHYTIFVEKDIYIARIKTIGIARHSVQLYESFFCLALFAFLFWFWKKHNINMPDGRISGFFFTGFLSLHVAFDSLKVNQASFLDGIGLSKGQVLSLPFILGGILILVLSYRKSTIRGKA